MPDARTLSDLSALAPWLEEHGVTHLFVISGPSRRFEDVLRDALGGLPVTWFDQATVHVPREVVDAAKEALAASPANGLLTLGGGAATGLGKALRLERDLPFVAVPTTWAGSEHTSIWGVRDGDEKQTGRDSAVRPDAVVEVAAFREELPVADGVASMMNALAHPISALSTGRLDDAQRRLAVSAVRGLLPGLESLVGAPKDHRTLARAAHAAVDGARVLETGTLGDHHTWVHRVSGRFELPHAPTHAALLPHTVRRLFQTTPDAAAALAEAAPNLDLPALLFDLLRASGARTSWSALGLGYEALSAYGSEDGEGAVPTWLWDAFYGRRPSVHVVDEDLGLAHPVARLGPALAEATEVIIALHGRGSHAGRALEHAALVAGHDPRTTVLAPQAAAGRHYPKAYRASRTEHGEDLVRALAEVSTLVEAAVDAVGRDQVWLYGFSQGACLALEVLLTTPHRLGGCVAIAGAAIDSTNAPAPAASLEGVPVVLGIAREDAWVDAADTVTTAAHLKALGARVTEVYEPGELHILTPRQLLAAREARGRGPGHQSGFGNTHSTEALPGALPEAQNTPRHGPYGLYPEQLNATGFVAPRADNRRVWCYRIRPAAQQRPFAPVAHATLGRVGDATPDPNLLSGGPLPRPEAPTDFVDGLFTVGGAGDATLRRGYALHLYAANRSMPQRAFSNVDGELLVLPQEGSLLLQTELGVLRCAPGELAVIPRGLRFSVHLEDEAARGYVGEVYGGHFRLPDRGPIGANALADARHFLAPAACFEDRAEPGYRLATKTGDQLFEATCDHSPYDVVAWHGNESPYVYRLSNFAPVSNVRVDHADPSVYTVLTAPLDEPGAHALDLVVFPPRWDPTEQTFRPPYFHRNGTTEINGIVRDPSLTGDGAFVPGRWFVTPQMTGHGVVARSAEMALARSEEVADRPTRSSDESLWFQFETALPFLPTARARSSAHAVADWPDLWGVWRSHFDPNRGPPGTPRRGS